jgi:hypothetical protein
LIRSCYSAIVLITLFTLGAPSVSAQQWVNETATRFPASTGEYSNYLDIGDIDNDGDLDIVWANGGNYNTLGPAQLERIFINNGSGVFTDESVARGAASGNARGVELGDLDNDGDLDIVYAQDFNKQPIVMINDGTGHFTNQSAARLPATMYSSARIALGDIDNDGDLDMYICNSGTSNRFGSGQNRIYVNDGTGVFTDETATRHPVAVLNEAMDAIFGDIDGDFDLDVRAASTANNNSRLYRNNGSGVFTTVAGVPADANAYSYDFGDIDGDGNLDLLGANANGSGNNSEFLLRNDGTGAYTNVSSNISPNPTTDDNDTKFVDYDNDGDMDFIVGSLGTTERVYNNNGSGVFTQVAGLITAVSDSTLDIKVADLNGDGRPDVVTAQGESGTFVDRIYIMNNAGAVDTRGPRIVATEQLANTASAGPYVVRAAILDGVSSDRNFWDKGILLKYSVDAGPVSQVTMRYSGGQIYRGVIPTVAPCGGTVFYYVVATDFANNTTIGPTKSFLVMPAGTGDLDADGDVDDADGIILANVLLDADVDPAHLCRADVNSDTLLDGGDIQKFIELIP